MHPEQLAQLVVEALDEVKAVNVRVIDVRGITSITDFMVIASGRTDRQVRAMAKKVEVMAKEHGVASLGMEGQREGEWVLLDLGDVVVHAMQPAARDFYQIEKLWADAAGQERSAVH